MYAGEMVGKMTRAKSNDEEKEGHDEEDDEDDKAKKSLRSKFRLQTF